MPGYSLGVHHGPPCIAALGCSVLDLPLRDRGRAQQLFGTSRQPVRNSSAYLRHPRTSALNCFARQGYFELPLCLAISMLLESRPFQTSPAHIRHQAETALLRHRTSALAKSSFRCPSVHRSRCDVDSATHTTKVSSSLSYCPVTSQHPSVGRSIPTTIDC